MRPILISLLAVFLLSTALAQEGRIGADLKVEVRTGDGRWIDAPTMAFPFGDAGQLVRFTITLTNRDDAPIPPGEVVFTGEVYEGTRYVAHEPPLESEARDPRPLYASVRYRLRSGGFLPDPPVAERIAGVQWRLLEALAPDAAVDFRYQVRVSAGTAAADRED